MLFFLNAVKPIKNFTTNLFFACKTVFFCRAENKFGSISEFIKFRAAIRPEVVWWTRIEKHPKFAFRTFLFALFQTEIFFRQFIDCKLTNLCQFLFSFFAITTLVMDETSVECFFVIAFGNLTFFAVLDLIAWHFAHDLIVMCSQWC